MPGWGRGPASRATIHGISARDYLADIAHLENPNHSPITLAGWARRAPCGKQRRRPTLDRRDGGFCTGSAGAIIGSKVTNFGR